MTYLDHLLNQLADECVEVAHRALKAQKFGIKEIQAQGPSTQKTGEAKLSNDKRIRQEYADLVGVYEMLQEAGYLKPPSRRAIAAKKRKVLKYLYHAAMTGTFHSLVSVKPKGLRKRN